MKDSAAPNPSPHGYLGRLTQLPLLTAQEERELTAAAQAGCLESRDRLVERNIRLVINIAKAYQSRSVPLEDLIQEGAIGLMTAIERFDASKGFRFSTYATHWIRQAIGRAIDCKAKTIRLPAHISQSLRKIERVRNDLTQRTGYDPTPEQIARELGMSVRKLNGLMQVSQELISLDIQVGEAENTLGSLLHDVSARDPEEEALQSEIIEELHEVLLLLTDRERRIVTYRLRHDDGTTRFRDELSEELHITRERVRQIEIQAIKKLRQLAARRRAREYLS